MSPPLFAEDLATALFVLHALLAFATLGATTHQGILAVGYLRGRVARAALEALYGRILRWIYGFAFLTGALVYPTYRVRVRMEVLDPTAPWASNAFDIKENLGSLVLLLVFGLPALRRAFTPAAGDATTRLYAALTLSGASLTWLMVILGLLVTAEEGLG